MIAGCSFASTRSWANAGGRWSGAILDSALRYTRLITCARSQTASSVISKPHTGEKEVQLPQTFIRPGTATTPGLTELFPKLLSIWYRGLSG